MQTFSIVRCNKPGYHKVMEKNVSVFYGSYTACLTYVGARDLGAGHYESCEHARVVSLYVEGSNHDATL